MSTIIELQNICYHYPNSEKGLLDVSLNISSGQKMVVLGLNGAGKSTLFLTLCGVLRPQKGKYFLEGKPFIYGKKERRKIGETIGYVFQDPEVQLFAPTVYDDVAFGLRNSGVGGKEVNAKVGKYLEFLNITHLRDNSPHELSYGQKKLVALAGILVMQPKVLILDEPFAWLDMVQERNMKQLLDKFHQQGITIVLSTHNLDFAFSWAENIAVLRAGKCVFNGDKEEIKQLGENFLEGV